MRRFLREGAALLRPRFARLPLSLGLALVLGLLCVGVKAANADSYVPEFEVPSFYGASNSTYQEWTSFGSVTANAPNYSANLNGIPNFWDTTSTTDGAFLTSTGHIYSFAGVLNPEVDVPNFGYGSAWNTDVEFQLQTEGNPVDTSSILLTDGVSSYSPDSVVHTSTTVTGAGYSYSVDTYKVYWSGLSGNTSGYTITYAAADTSVSQVAARVDTVTSPN